MGKTNNALLWGVRILLSVACAGMVAFILYNSIQTAVESAKQSSRAVEVVQQVVAVVAPNSPIVTATGDVYDRLHALVRTLAHFTEYALLGVLAGWCYRAYTDQKVWLLAPGVGIVLLAMVDECLQLTAEGRGAQFVDVVVDVFGGAIGLAFALLTVWLVVKVVAKRRVHETR